TGERRVGWRDRRREVMEILAMIRRLHDDAEGRGPERWRRLAPGVSEVLARLGVPAYEVRMADKPIVREGHAGGTWAWLGLPLPDSDGAEIRLALAVRLPDLQQEQLMLVERVVGLVSGTPVARQSSSSASLALPGEDAPAPGSPIAP